MAEHQPQQQGERNEDRQVKFAAILPDDEMSSLGEKTNGKALSR